MRYARPLDLRRQPGVDAQRIIAKVLVEAGERDTGGLPKVAIKLAVESGTYFGEFDAAALTEAFKAITDDLRATLSAKEPQSISVAMRRNETGQALIEWHGGHLSTRSASLSSGGCGTIHTEVARKIIEAHGGAVICEPEVVRALLPMTNENTE